MGSLVLAGQSGEGIASLSGGASVQVSEVLSEVSITSPKVRILGVDDPKALRYCGSVWLGYAPDPSGLITTGIVLWDDLIRWNGQDFWIGYLGLFVPDFGWKLPPGVSANFWVFW